MHTHRPARKSKEELRRLGQQVLSRIGVCIRTSLIMCLHLVCAIWMKRLIVGECAPVKRGGARQGQSQLFHLGRFQKVSSPAMRCLVVGGLGVTRLFRQRMLTPQTCAAAPDRRSSTPWARQLHARPSLRKVCGTAKHLMDRCHQRGNAFLEGALLLHLCTSNDSAAVRRLCQQHYLMV